MSGLAYPSVKGDLRKLTGCKAGTICTATEKLVYYGLIEKKRAPKGFRFRMIYRVKWNPEIRPDIIPFKRKQCKPQKDKKSGKFIRSPSMGQLYIVPS